MDAILSILPICHCGTKGNGQMSLPFKPVGTTLSLTTETKRSYTTQSILRIWLMMPTVLYRSARLQILYNE